MEKADAYILSDAHLGIHIPGCTDRERVFIEFVKQAASFTKNIIFLGDIFDFWIEYNSCIRRDLFEVMYLFRQLTDAGIRVDYLAGNHDFALGSFLSESCGITIHPHRYQLRTDTKDALFMHGDGVLPHDVGYRILRKILRNRRAQDLYKKIHPAWGIALGHRCSGMSRKVTQNIRVSPTIKNQYKKAAVRMAQKHSAQIVFFGHIHSPQLFVNDQYCYCNPGEWIRTYGYATLTKGAVRLWEHIPGETDRSLPAQSW